MERHLAVWLADCGVRRRGGTFVVYVVGEVLTAWLADREVRRRRGTDCVGRGLFLCGMKTLSKKPFISVC